MKGTAKVKDSSSYIYRGLTLNILGIYMVHQDEKFKDIYPVGSVEYKLSLMGTEFETRFDKPEYAITIIHEKHLEDIKVEGEIEVEVWFHQLNKFGIDLLNQMFNQDGSKSRDEIYDCVMRQIELETARIFTF